MIKEGLIYPNGKLCSDKLEHPEKRKTELI